MKLIDKINIFLIIRPLITRFILFLVIFLFIKIVSAIIINEPCTQQVLQISAKEHLIRREVGGGLMILYILYKILLYIIRKIISIRGFLKTSAIRNGFNYNQLRLIILLLIVLFVMYLIILIPIITTIHSSICVGANTVLEQKYYNPLYTIVEVLFCKYNLFSEENFIDSMAMRGIKENFINAIVCTIDITALEAQNLTLTEVFETEIKTQKYLIFLFFIGLNLFLLSLGLSFLLVKNKVIKIVTFIRVCALLITLSVLCFLNVGFMLYISIFNVFNILSIIMLVLVIIIEYKEYYNNNNINCIVIIYWFLLICVLVFYTYVVSCLLFDKLNITDYVIEKGIINIKIIYTNMFKYYYLDIIAYKIMKEDFYFAKQSYYYVQLNGFKYKTLFAQSYLIDVQGIRVYLANASLLTHKESLHELFDKSSHILNEKCKQYNTLIMGYGNIKLLKESAFTELTNYYQQLPSTYKMHIFSRNDIIFDFLKTVNWDVYAFTVDCYSQKMSYLKASFSSYLENYPKSYGKISGNTLIELSNSICRYIIPGFVFMEDIMQGLHKFQSEHILITWNTNYHIIHFQLVNLTLNLELPKTYVPPDRLIAENPFSAIVIPGIELHIMTPDQVRIEMEKFNFKEQCNFLKNIFCNITLITIENKGLHIYIGPICIIIH